VVVGVLAAGFAGFMGLDNLANLTNVGTLCAFMIVCITVIYLRIVRPKMKREFRTPLYPATPILGAVMCFFLLMSLMAIDITRNFFLIYLGAGIALYFVYGLWHSKLGKGVVVQGTEHIPLSEVPHPGVKKDPL
jgi:APA family basic amino acid/polyamine antiporter